MLDIANLSNARVVEAWVRARAYDRFRTGFVLVGEGGRLLYMNDQAKGWLDQQTQNGAQPGNLFTWLPELARHRPAIEELRIARQTSLVLPVLLDVSNARGASKLCVSVECLREFDNVFLFQFTNAVDDLDDSGPGQPSLPNRPESSLISAAREATAELERSARRYEYAFEHASSGKAIVHSSGYIVIANKALEGLLGVKRPDLEGMRLEELLSADEGFRISVALERARDGAMPVKVKESRMGCGQVQVWVNWNIIPVFDEPSRMIRHYLCEFIDVTTRVESDRTLTTIMDRLPGFVYRVEETPDGPRLLGALPRRFKTGELARDEYARDWMATLHPEDREKYQETVAAAAVSGGSYDVEYRMANPDGEIHWVWDQGYFEPQEENGHRRRTGLLLNITQRKAAEERLVCLSRRLLEAQEKERRRIAQEIHDDFGQQLTAIKMALQLAGPNFPQQREAVLGQVDALYQSLRQLSCLLRPKTLDDFGLQDALKDLLAQVRGPVETALRYSPDVPRCLPGEIETSAYRIAQEALNNAMRHAHAARIGICVGLEGEALKLEVLDDGQGFEPAALKRERRSLGIVGMQERAELVGGELTFRSWPGKGTRVRVRLPLHGYGNESNGGER